MLRKNSTFLPLCASVALILLLALASVAHAAHSQPESWAALTAQANKGQVESALIIPTKNEVRVRLRDGSHFIATYPTGGEAQAEALLRAHGATVTVHKTKKASSGHVRYRYIALAILALGALAALGYYLLRGRPTPRGAGTGTGQPPAAGAAPEAPGEGAPTTREGGPPPA